MAFKAKGSATVYLFKKTPWPKLWRMIMPETSKKAPKNDSIAVDNIESLDFSLISADAKNKEITIRLKGDADFVGGGHSQTSGRNDELQRKRLYFRFPKLSRH